MSNHLIRPVAFAPYFVGIPSNTAEMQSHIVDIRWFLYFVYLAVHRNNNQIVNDYLYSIFLRFVVRNCLMWIPETIEKKWNARLIRWKMRMKCSIYSILLKESPINQIQNIFWLNSEMMFVDNCFYGPITAIRWKRQIYWHQFKIIVTDTFNDVKCWAENLFECPY